MRLVFRRYGLSAGEPVNAQEFAFALLEITPASTERG